MTDAIGQGTLASGWVKGGGTFTFTVIGVTHPNGTWDGVSVSARWQAERGH